MTDSKIKPSVTGSRGREILVEAGRTFPEMGRTKAGRSPEVLKKQGRLTLSIDASHPAGPKSLLGTKKPTSFKLKLQLDCSVAMWP